MGTSVQEEVTNAGGEEQQVPGALRKEAPASKRAARPPLNLEGREERKQVGNNLGVSQQYISGD